MSTSCLASFNVFTVLRLSKALASVWPPFNASSIAMEAESGLRLWWMEAPRSLSRFPAAGDDYAGNHGTHSDGRGRSQRRRAHSDGVGGLQPQQRDRRHAP